MLEIHFTIEYSICQEISDKSQSFFFNIQENRSSRSMNMSSSNSFKNSVHTPVKIDFTQRKQLKRKPGGISDRIFLMKSLYQSISVTGLFRLFLSVSVSTPPVLRSIYKQRNFLNPSPGNPIWKCLVISSSLSSAPTFTEFIVGGNLRIARGDAKFPAFPHF